MTLRILPLILATSALALAVTPALAEKKAKANGHSAQHSQHQSSKAKSPKSKSAQAPSAQIADDAEVTEEAEAHGKGKLASELKGLNAAHASANAMEHASPNSQVGRIAAYREAALATQEKADLLELAKTDLAALPEPTRSVADIDAEIAGLDLLDPDYAAKLEALELEKSAAQDYEDAYAAVEAAQIEVDAAAAIEGEALLTASKGRELSPEALAYFRSLLNL